MHGDSHPCPLFAGTDGFDVSGGIMYNELRHAFTARA